ncbi:hypothetical protein FA09DRAFT_238133 [Tilletiopsis washingtonensis]|uniref:Uncharacterized protein n=1 Tax=Tilletiopsis washingtonensis TaxID=58919 RepID=A0A316ZFF3_9BASI|nr:hypothetical protein FA09DRAFT_238133 [Tilletiopsis washingtonensis]PWN99003.1 hypothetical protein FA09DRAFT_238133 [Tilletiopsis washingtonensis]
MLRSAGLIDRRAPSMLRNQARTRLRQHGSRPFGRAGAERQWPHGRLSRRCARVACSTHALRAMACCCTCVAAQACKEHTERMHDCRTVHVATGAGRAPGVVAELGCAAGSERLECCVHRLHPALRLSIESNGTLTTSDELPHLCILRRLTAALSAPDQAGRRRRRLRRMPVRLKRESEPHSVQHAAP